MTEAQIEFKDGPGPWQSWCIRVGTREEYKRGQVSIVDSRGKRRLVRLNGGGEAKTPEEPSHERAVPASPLTVKFENPLA